MYACTCTYKYACVSVGSCILNSCGLIFITLNCYCQNQRECDYVNSLNLKFDVKLGLLGVVGCSRFDKTFICLRSMYVCMHSDAVDLNIVT